jgi:alanine racemase
MVLMYRKTYVEIDENILKENIKEIKNKYNEYKYYIGVVKNNAYHHGIKVINSLIEGGVNYLAVSSLEEAVEIRRYNHEIPILVLEPVCLDFIDDVINNHVTITVESLDYLKKLNNESLPYKINIHLKIDSGMNRLGFKKRQEINEAVKIISENDKLFLEGIYTHLATSGVSDYHYDAQINKFLELTSDISLKDIPIVHVDRSLTFVHHEKLEFVNGIRLGIAMFGFNGSRKTSKGLKSKLREVKREMYLKHYNVSTPILENDLKLKTAFKLYSHVFAIRKVKKGEFVGYEACYKVKEDAFIATIPIGYADGVDKRFSFVAINNKKYPIVADAMDMLMVLVDEAVNINDKVEIMGDTISIRSVANRLGVNAYHLFNQISTRVPIVHVKKNERVEIKY